MKNVTRGQWQGGVRQIHGDGEPGVALAEAARVGILDADIYGPSIPLLMGDERPCW